MYISLLVSMNQKMFSYKFLMHTKDVITSFKYLDLVLWGEMRVRTSNTDAILLALLLEITSGSSREPSWVQGIEPRLGMCKSSALLDTLSFWPLLDFFLRGAGIDMIRIHKRKGKSLLPTREAVKF